ncbi:uncharacterized protein LOC118407108 [Branchiostoma floridae]|uniref:Uncharacterized protein LOC118407108 n=1 Tax=Branchiostoma floridae TaxID=7739 RepID=A0A9J7HS86_BRAFL|nr:uncharacterized protein LOC118407108 [Branchiostoma floridae]
MSKESSRSLMEWEPVSERIITARFTSRCQDTTIIQAYAPTNDASEVDKELFYEQLQATMAKRKKRDITILMGDMNAKVGSANSGNEGVMGKHGVGTMNHNGELFVDFCSVNDMVIGGTLFPHKESHKVTWRSPDGSYENQIDHIAISRRWRGTLQDCRIKRSADVGSDHHLLMAACRVRLAACRKKVQKTTKYNVERLKNPDMKQQFVLTLANRFDVLRYNSDNEEELDDDEIETEWSTIKEAYTSTCEEVLGKVKRERKEWMSEGTWEKVEERRKLKANIENCRTRNQKANAMKQYNSADRKVKKSCRRDKRKWISDKAAEAEEAASKQDMKTLYRITKTLSGKRRQINKPVQDKNGKLLATKEQQMERWRDHFKEILNRTPPPNPPEIEPPIELLDIRTGPPSKIEIRKARTSLWNILAHYGIPPKIINMIKVFYNNFQAQVSHEGDLTEPFNMTTGVRQGCLLSPLLFITALDWVMRETTKDARTGIQWTLTDMLDDLDFADDLALLCHTISQMREKTQRLEHKSGQVGLIINAGKTKEMRVKTVGNAKPVCCRGIELETVKDFTYLGSVISSDGGATKDIEARIGKGKAAFVQLRPVWRARKSPSEQSYVSLNPMSSPSYYMAVKPGA